MDFQNTLRNIKSLKIQGAEHVATAGLKSLKTLILKSRARSPQVLISQVRKARAQLIATRPTEPLLRNSLKFVCQYRTNASTTTLKHQLLHNINHLLKSEEANIEIIAKQGARKVPRGGVAFTHCHSSTVMAVFKEARKTKNFIVHNTEAQPRLQGRITAKELSKANIRVIHYTDSAARLALKEADVMFIGCDAITPKTIVNKIGSELFAEIAHNYNIPIYVCTDSLKFDPATLHGKEEKLEMRNPSEIWKTPPKKIKVLNYAFEKINPSLITGIISELGIHTHKQFLKEIQHNYPWLWKKKGFI